MQTDKVTYKSKTSLKNAFMIMSLLWAREKELVKIVYTFSIVQLLFHILNIPWLHAYFVYVKKTYAK